MKRCAALLIGSAVAFAVGLVYGQIAVVDAQGDGGYLGSVLITVGHSSSSFGAYGYLQDDYGGLTGGKLPGALFTDGRSRPAAQLANFGTRLDISYPDTESAGLFNDDLKWYRLQVRDVENNIVAEANLWDGADCGPRWYCVTLNASLMAHDGQPLAVDFFDAKAEADTANPGGLARILIVSDTIESSPELGSGYNGDQGALVDGALPREFFADGVAREPDQVLLALSGRMQFRYGASAPGGQFLRSATDYDRYAIQIKDRSGNLLHSIPMRPNLESASAGVNSCNAEYQGRRLCLTFEDAFSAGDYDGQVLVIQFEDRRVKRSIARVPGGPIAGQIGLTLFAGAMMAIKGRRMRSPGREIAIMMAMCFGSLALPVIGMGTLFWTGGVCLLTGLAIAAVYFLKSRAA